MLCTFETELNIMKAMKYIKNFVIGIHEENGVISLVTEQGTVSSH